jgi:autotransporter-associated beta strand protein
MSVTCKKSIARVAVAVFAAVGAAWSSTAQAALYNWVGNDSANATWGVLANWNLSVSPFSNLPATSSFNNTNDFAFPTTTNVLSSNALGNSRTIRSLTFGASVGGPLSIATVTGVTTGNGTAATLTFDTDSVAAGATATLTVASGATGNITIGRPTGTTNIGSVALADNLDVVHNGTGTLLINRPITGAGFGFTKSGTGTMRLSPSTLTTNSFTGAVNVNGGRLIADAPDAAADFPNASAVNLGGGTLEISGSTVTKSFTRDTTVSADSMIAYSNTTNTDRTFTIGTGALTLNGNLTVKNEATDLTVNNIVNVSRNLTGTGNIVVSTQNNIASNSASYSLQRVQLSGANSGWSGNLVIARGTGQLSGDAAQGTGSIVIGTTADSFGAGLSLNQTTAVTVARNITVNSGGFRGLKNNNLGGVADVGLTSYTGYNMLFSGNVVLNGTLSVDHSLINSTTAPLTPTAGAAPATTVGHTVTFSGNISGAGGLDVTRTHTAVGNASNSNRSRLVLTGINTYTGATTVSSAAALILDGSLTSNISVNGGRFGGDGSTTGSLTMAAGSTLVFSPAATIDVDGTVTLDPSFGITSLVNADGTSIDWSSISFGTYTLIGSTTSSFSGIQNFGLANAAAVVPGVKLAYFQQGSLQVVVTPVPEPTTLAMFVTLGSLVTLRRRRD